jgi:hypothetical protein
MHRWGFRRRVRDFIHKVQPVWHGDRYDGEVFIAGGVFKPLLSSTARWNDIDLWVRDNAARAKFDCHLRSAGFVLKRDFKPFCRAYEKDDTSVEITYHNLKTAGAARIFRDFDLSPSRIGARIENGEVKEVEIATDFWESLERKVVRFSPRRMRKLREEHLSQILHNLHRLAAWAENLGWKADKSQEAELWDLFENRYPPSAKKEAIELAWQILGVYKNCPESPVWERVRQNAQTKAILDEIESKSS